MRLRYDRVAWFYDHAASLYSLGAIERAKARTLVGIRAGERVLFAGAGTGSDSLAAARVGACVTAIEKEAAMHRRLVRRFERAGCSARLLKEDLRDHSGGRVYDRVVANFFLNVFDGVTMPVVFEALVRCLAPGGLLAIADFSPGPKGGPYYGVAGALFRVLANNPMHKVYDYGILRSGRLLSVDSGDEPVFRGGPALRVWRFRCRDSGSA